MLNNKVNLLVPLDEAQLILLIAAYEDFFANFKSTETSDATDALAHLRLDGDRTSDEYDFMDDAEDDDTTNSQTRTTQRSRDSKHKYVNLFEEVANRRQNHITVDLDDIKEVNHAKPRYSSPLTQSSGKSQWTAT